MKKTIRIIVNIILTIICLAMLAIFMFFINEYIIGNEYIAEIYSPLYEDQKISIPKELIGENGDTTLDSPFGSEQTINVDNTNKLYYSQIDDSAKIIYNKLSENRENMKQGNYVLDFGKTFNDLLHQEDGESKMNVSYQSALDAYLLDNPDIFYLDVSKMYLFMNAKTMGRKTTYTVTIGAEDGKYYYSDSFSSEEEVNQAIKMNEAVRDEILSYTSGSEYDKLKQIHDLLVGNLSYEQTLSKPNIRNIYGALCEREVVCEGYAKAYKYILDYIGIENIIVVGYGINSNNNGEDHAWNYVKLDGNWYAVDVTWDDPIIVGGGRLTETVKHRYFLRGSKEFESSHDATGKTSQGGIQFLYPELSVTDYK